MGMALTSCIVPAAGTPTFELGDDEIEIGIGIHGEPGRQRRKLAPASEIVENLATPIVEDLPYEQGDERPRLRERHGRDSRDRALHRLTTSSTRLLEERGIKIARNLIGSYITSLGDGGHVDHAAQAGRVSSLTLVGRTRPHAGPQVGHVVRWRLCG